MMSESASSAPPAGRVPPRAVTDVGAHLRLWVTSIAVLAADLWSKDWAFKRLDPAEPYHAVPRILDFHQSLNDGAVFGSLTGMVGLFIVASLLALLFVFSLFMSSDVRQQSLHIGLGLILAGALGNLYDRAFMKADVIELASGERRIGIRVDPPVGQADQTSWRWLGRWPDGEDQRAYPRSEIVEERNQGVVRDFIKFVPRFPAWVPKLAGRDIWPWVFNIADAALVCGVGLLLINFWTDRRRHAREAESPVE
jgi:signal peptidase II